MMAQTGLDLDRGYRMAWHHSLGFNIWTRQSQVQLPEATLLLAQGRTKLDPYFVQQQLTGHILELSFPASLTWLPLGHSALS